MRKGEGKMFKGQGKLWKTIQMLWSIGELILEILYFLLGVVQPRYQSCPDELLDIRKGTND